MHSENKTLRELLDSRVTGSAPKRFDLKQSLTTASPPASSTISSSLSASSPSHQLTNGKKSYSRSPPSDSEHFPTDSDGIGESTNSDDHSQSPPSHVTPGVHAINGNGLPYRISTAGFSNSRHSLPPSSSSYISSTVSEAESFKLPRRRPISMSGKFNVGQHEQAQLSNGSLEGDNDDENDAASISSSISDVTIVGTSDTNGDDLTNGNNDTVISYDEQHHPEDEICEESSSKDKSDPSLTKCEPVVAPSLTHEVDPPL